MARPFADTLRNPAAVSRFVLTTVIGLSVDLWTKSLAFHSLKGASPVYLIPGWLQLEYVANPGAVFGIAPGQRVAFLFVSVIAIGFLTYLFTGSGRRPFYQIVLGMLLAGVLGNMYDRVLYSDYHGVRDMIHALPGRRWPESVHDKLTFLQPEVFPYIFNVADMLLCTGVGLMLVYSFVSNPKQLTAAHPTEPGRVGPVVDAE